MPVSVEQLLFSYGNYLRAKAQEMEMDPSFGGTVMTSFRKTIADHQELEAAYIRELKARRDAQTAQFKERLEGKG